MAAAKATLPPTTDAGTADRRRAAVHARTATGRQVRTVYLRHARVLCPPRAGPATEAGTSEPKRRRHPMTPSASVRSIPTPRSLALATLLLAFAPTPLWAQPTPKAPGVQRTAQAATTKNTPAPPPRQRAARAEPAAAAGNGLRWRYNGRVQADHARFDGVYGRDGGAHSATYLRRGTLGGSVQWHPQWRAAGAIEMDSEGKLALDSLAVAWSPRDRLTLRAGRIDPDFGLEHSTSSSWTWGVERSAIWDLAPDLADAGKGAGLRVDAHGGDWQASAGVYDKRGHGAAVARAVWRPLDSPGRRLHLGASVAGSFGWQDDGRIRTRLGVRGVTEDPLGRRSTLGAAAPTPGAYDGDSSVGVEALWQQGPFTVQAEALQRRLAAKGDAGGPGSRTAQGAYLLLAWAITGEPRRYDDERARLRSAGPANTRWGAWEVFYRVDGLDVSDGASATVHTAGLGWTAEDTWRAMLNVHSARSGDANVPGQHTGMGLSARLQAVF